MEYNSPLELRIEATMANNHYGVWASVGTDVVLSNNTMRSFPWTYKNLQHILGQQTSTDIIIRLYRQ